MSREKSSAPYRSCYYLESGITFFPQGLVFCCDRPSPATVQPMADVSKTVDVFFETRDRVIDENQKNVPPCEGCLLLQNCVQTDGQIEWINFSVHTYCQFACTYCGLGSGDSSDKNKVEPYDAIEIAKELKRRGLLSKHLHIECSPGEIAIHPKRDEYYDFIEENADSVTFYTNAGKFDGRMAHILQSKPRSMMIVSIDCGTADTFRKIRGVDMFQQVVTNLMEYRKYTSAIWLKYILLDENCSEVDLSGFIHICKDLDISWVMISGDTNKNYNGEYLSGYDEHIVCAAMKLVKSALRHSLNFSFVDALNPTNLREIYRRILLLSEIISAENELGKILSAKKVVCYGAGGNCENVLKQVKELGLRRPDVIWDIKAEGAEANQKFCAAGCEYPVCCPDFGQLNDSMEIGVFTTITNGAVNQKLASDMKKHGFSNILTHDRLELALHAKRARLLI